MEPMNISVQYVLLPAPSRPETWVWFNFPRQDQNLKYKWHIININWNKRNKVYNNKASFKSRSNGLKTDDKEEEPHLARLRKPFWLPLHERWIVTLFWKEIKKR